MKNFIGVLLKYCFASVIILSVISTCNNFLVSKSMQPENFKIMNQITDVIIGDSHTETAINPAIVNHSINISQTGEDYFYSYLKLRLILEANPDINTIILGFSFNNLSKYNLGKVFGKNTFPMYSRYFMLMDTKEIHQIANLSNAFVLHYLKYQMGIPLNYKMDAKRNFRYLTNRLEPEDYPFWGGYYSSYRSKLNARLVDETIDRHYRKNRDELYGISEFEVHYLNKIIGICNKKNIRTLLVQTPLAPMYREKVPALYKTAYQNMIVQLQNKYRKLEYLDFSEVSLADSCYGDGDHVNHYGANIVSIKLNKYLIDKVSIAKNTLEEQ